LLPTHDLIEIHKDFAQWLSLSLKQICHLRISVALPFLSGGAIRPASIVPAAKRSPMGEAAPGDPLKRKIQASLDASRYELGNAYQAGVEVLTRIRAQAGILGRADEHLTPISGMSQESNRFIGTISKTLSSGRRLFFLLAVVAIIILWLVIRWKSKSR
jgi:hypothetical protein